MAVERLLLLLLLLLCGRVNECLDARLGVDDDDDADDNVT